MCVCESMFLCVWSRFRGHYLILNRPKISTSSIRTSSETRDRLFSVSGLCSVSFTLSNTIEWFLFKYTCAAYDCFDDDKQTHARRWAPAGWTCWRHSWRWMDWRRSRSSSRCLALVRWRCRGSRWTETRSAACPEEWNPETRWASSGRKDPLQRAQTGDDANVEMTVKAESVAMITWEVWRRSTKKHRPLPLLHIDRLPLVRGKHVQV